MARSFATEASGVYPFGLGGPVIHLPIPGVLALPLVRACVALGGCARHERSPAGRGGGGVVSAPGSAPAPGKPQTSSQNRGGATRAAAIAPPVPQPALPGARVQPRSARTRLAGARRG